MTGHATMEWSGRFDVASGNICERRRLRPASKATVVRLRSGTQVAVINAVSQRIGLACATSLLAEGARVLGISRSVRPSWPV
jgi:hypothetical protein